MQRKAGYPTSSCSIRLPDPCFEDASRIEIEAEVNPQRRQLLVNFGHSQWGFSNWSWGVLKQDLDFVDYTNGKYSVGVAALVSVTVKSLDIHREDFGYATCIAASKGAAIFQARKCAVTNALRETLIDFGGTVASELLELLEENKNVLKQSDSIACTTAPIINAQATAIKEIKNANLPQNHNKRKDTADVAIMNPINNKENIAAAPQGSVAKNKSPPKLPIQSPANQVNSSGPINQIPPKTPNMMPMNAAPTPLMQQNVPVPRVSPIAKPMTEEEQRAERKRRQKQAQEEFRLKLLQKNESGGDSNDVDISDSGLDDIIMEFNTQEIVRNPEEVNDHSTAKRSIDCDRTANRKRLNSCNKLRLE